MCTETKRWCSQFRCLVFSILTLVFFLNAAKFIFTEIEPLWVNRAKSSAFLKLWWILKGKLFAIIIWSSIITWVNLTTMNSFYVKLHRIKCYSIQPWDCHRAICPMLIIIKIIHQRHSVFLVLNSEHSWYNRVATFNSKSNDCNLFTIQQMWIPEFFIFFFGII